MKRDKMLILAGVYGIKNMISGKWYIGSSRNIYRRWMIHKWNAVHKWQKNRYFYGEVNEYGIENFEFAPLKIFNGEFSQEDLDCYENFYMEHYRSTNPEFGYNRRGAGKNGRCTAESKRDRSGEKSHLFGKKGPLHPMFGRGKKREMHNEVEAKDLIDISQGGKVLK